MSKAKMRPQPLTKSPPGWKLPDDVDFEPEPRPRRPVSKPVPPPPAVWKAGEDDFVANGNGVVPRLRGRGSGTPANGVANSVGAVTRRTGGPQRPPLPPTRKRPSEQRVLSAAKPRKVVATRQGARTRPVESSSGEESELSGASASDFSEDSVGSGEDDGGSGSDVGFEGSEPDEGSSGSRETPVSDGYPSEDGEDDDGSSEVIEETEPEELLDEAPVKKACPYPGCDGSGHVNKTRKFHISIQSCPLAKRDRTAGKPGGPHPVTVPPRPRRTDVGGDANLRIDTGHRLRSDSVVEDRVRTLRPQSTASSFIRSPSGGREEIQQFGDVTVNVDAPILRRDVTLGPTGTGASSPVPPSRAPSPVQGKTPRSESLPPVFVPQYSILPEYDAAPFRGGQFHRAHHYIQHSSSTVSRDLEYDMDSEDERFLYDVNSGTRKKQKKFEAAMSAMEVENYILSQRMSLEHDEEKLDDRRKKSARTIVDLRRRYRELVSDASDEGEDDDDGEDDDEMGQPSSESEERLPKPRTRRSSNEESPQPTVDARKPSSAYSTFIEPLSKLFGGLGRSLGRRGTDGHSSTPSLLRVATPEDGLSDDGAPKPTPTSSLKRDSKGRFLKLPGHRRRRHRDHSHDIHDKQEASERPVKKPVESAHRHHHHHSHSPGKPSKPRGQSHGHHSHGRRHDSRPHPTLPPPPTHHYPQRPRRPVHAPPPTSLLPLVEIEHLGTMPGLNVLSRRPFGEGSASLSGVTRPSVWLTLQRARELMPSIEPSIQDKLFEHWKARRLELGPLVPSLHSVAIADASIDEDVGIRTRDAVMEAYNDLLELRQDMERARLVVDTALKREKLKREYIRTNNAMIRMATEDPSLLLESDSVFRGYKRGRSVALTGKLVVRGFKKPWNHWVNERPNFLI